MNVLLSSLRAFLSANDRKDNHRNDKAQKMFYSELYIAFVTSAHFDIVSWIEGNECAQHQCGSVYVWMSTRSDGDKEAHESFRFYLLDRVKSWWKKRGPKTNHTLNPFMDKQDSKAKRSYELVNPDLVITITMKKMENQTTSGAGTSGDSINNNSKNTSEKDTSSGDKNNNQQPPVANQYTKVTMEGFMSQLSLHQNRQMLQQLAQQGNTLAVNQINANKRWAIDLSHFPRKYNKMPSPIAWE